MNAFRGAMGNNSPKRTPPTSEDVNPNSDDDYNDLEDIPTMEDEVAYEAKLQSSFRVNVTQPKAAATTATATAEAEEEQ